MAGHEGSELCPTEDRARFSSARRRSSCLTLHEAYSIAESVTSIASEPSEKRRWHSRSACAGAQDELWSPKWRSLSKEQWPLDDVNTPPTTPGSPQDFKMSFPTSKDLPGRRCSESPSISTSVPESPTTQETTIPVEPQSAEAELLERRLAAISVQLLQRKSPSRRLRLGSWEDGVDFCYNQAHDGMDNIETRMRERPAQDRCAESAKRNLSSLCDNEIGRCRSDTLESAASSLLCPGIAKPMEQASLHRLVIGPRRLEESAMFALSPTRLTMKEYTAQVSHERADKDQLLRAGKSQKGGTYDQGNTADQPKRCSSWINLPPLDTGSAKSSVVVPNSWQAEFARVRTQPSDKAANAPTDELAPIIDHICPGNEQAAVLERAEDWLARTPRTKKSYSLFPHLHRRRATQD